MRTTSTTRPGLPRPWVATALATASVLAASIVSAGVQVSAVGAGPPLRRARAVTSVSARPASPAALHGPVLATSVGAPVIPLVPEVAVRLPLGVGAGLSITVPPGPGPHPVVLYAHGGGWVAGLADPVHIPAEFGLDAVLDAGWAFVSVGYRLADEDTGITVRDQLDDMRAALAWVRGPGSALGLGPEVVAVGHSAGAHLLAASSSLVEPELAPDAVVGVSGIYDFGPDVVAAPLLSPVLPVALGCRPGACDVSDFEPTGLVRPGGPPVTLVHGEADPVAVVATARRYADALSAAGVPVDLHVVPGAVHDGAELGAVLRTVLDGLLERSAEA